MMKVAEITASTAFQNTADKYDKCSTTAKALKERQTLNETCGGIAYVR
jgi:hypothetical protein